MADTNLENMELFPEGNVSAHFSQNPKAGKAANKSPNIANKIGGGTETQAQNSSASDNADKLTKRYTLIINYPKMSLGGIEVSLAKLMRYSLRNGHRVIWLTTGSHYEKADFPDVVKDKRLEIFIYKKNTRSWKLPDLRFHKEERVVMLSSDVSQYVVAEAMKRKYQIKEFKHFLLIAHYAGCRFFPDKWFTHDFAQKFAYSYYQRIIKRVAANNCLMFFSVKHVETYEKYFHVKIDNRQEKILPDLGEPDPLSLENMKVRCKERRERFVIISCARFDFPHKAYLLGLIDSFVKIKEKYPWAVLQIAGNGEGENQIMQKIKKLPGNVQESIQLLGLVSHDKLKEYYLNANLVIGLDGAACDGLRCGIPTLFVRHYSENCETYGFCECEKDIAQRQDPGKDIVPYIEHCMEMSEEEYIGYGLKGYDAVYKTFPYDPEYFYHQTNAEDSMTIRFPMEVMLGKFLGTCILMKEKING